MKSCWIGLMFAVAAMFGADNTLTQAERKAGWKLLFDGKTLHGWNDPGQRNPAGGSWKVADGWIVALPKPALREDLATAREYGDFELEFEWKIEPGTNSGIKYRVQDTVFLDFAKLPKGMTEIQDQLRYEIANHTSQRSGLPDGARGKDYSIGFECQIIDDERHADARADGGKHATGSLYDMVGPTSSPARPAGEINRTRLVVRGTRVQHWMNGVQVLDADLASTVVSDALAKRWGIDHPVYRLLTGPARQRGRIALTHHGDPASFRNLRIRER